MKRKYPKIGSPLRRSIEAYRYDITSTVYINKG